MYNSRGKVKWAIVCPCSFLYWCWKTWFFRNVLLKNLLLESNPCEKFKQYRNVKNKGTSHSVWLPWGKRSFLFLLGLSSLESTIWGCQQPSSHSKKWSDLRMKPSTEKQTERGSKKAWGSEFCFWSLETLVSAAHPLTVRATSVSFLFNGLINSLSSLDF